MAQDDDTTEFDETDLSEAGHDADEVARRLLALLDAQNGDAIAEERAALDGVVFNLTQAFENPPSSTFLDFSALLDRNARILNAAFEYYLDKAVDSPKADAKIRLAAQMQAQLVRTIDAWRRLENFHQGKTK